MLMKRIDKFKKASFVDLCNILLFTAAAFQILWNLYIIIELEKGTISDTKKTIDQHQLGVYKNNICLDCNGSVSSYYWNRRDRTEDKKYWPKKENGKYLLWDSWRAGFNNERMSLELAITFAYLLNRTLVLPESYKHYNLDDFQYEDYFDLEDLKQMLPVITYKEFVKITDLKDLENIYKIDWKDIAGASGIFVYPEVPDNKTDPEKWKEMLMFATSQRTKFIRSIKIHPELVTEKIIYIPRGILLNHYYMYFYITDPVMDRHLKRMMRDYVHLRADIWDLSVKLRQKLPHEYYAIHLRKGDFQYRQRNIHPHTIYNNIKNLIPNGSTIYLSSDEKNDAVLVKEFLGVMGKFYKIVRFKDLTSELEIKKKIIPMVEQVLCAHAEIFVGTLMSTYSGYITRLRGYMPQIENKEIYFTSLQYPDGYQHSTLFIDGKYKWGDYWVKIYWSREFKDAWENIDE